MSKSLAALILTLWLAACWSGCRNAPEGGSKPLSMPQRSIEQVQAEKSPEWMSWEGVVGTAISQLENGRPCLVVYLAYDDPQLRARFPEAVEGYPVILEVSGEFHAMPDTGGGGAGP